MTPFHPLLYNSFLSPSPTIPLTLHTRRRHQRDLLPRLLRQSLFLHQQRAKDHLRTLGQREQLLHLPLSHRHVYLTHLSHTHSADPRPSHSAAPAPTLADTPTLHTRLPPMKRPFPLLNVTLSKEHDSTDSAGDEDSSLGETVMSDGDETPGDTLQIETLGSRGNATQRLLQLQLGFHDSTDGDLT